MQDATSLPMLMRYINVALLCVQENAADRPTMLNVVSMINNENDSLRFPKEPAFAKGRNVRNSSHFNSRTSELRSLNDVTVSLVYPR